MTAEDVVWNIICSLPFSSAIKCASSISILCELVSRLPPNCGDVSATTSVIPPRAEDIDASVVFFNALADASCISIVSLDVSRAGDKAYSLKVKNGPISVDYVLSDLSVIADPPALKRLPEFGTQIKLDNNFINTFIKGKGALSDVDTFTIVNGDNGCEVVIGYSSTNTNRVNIPVETTSNDLTDPITFNANLFKEVLVANRECTSAVLEVSNEGLARVNFKVDDYDSTYYVVAMQDID